MFNILPFKNGEIVERLRCIIFQAFSIQLMTKQSHSLGLFIVDILTVPWDTMALQTWGGTNSLQLPNTI